ncbi:metallophosphoesterase [Synechococcus sp. RC10B2]|uniref:metallophosphoesterase family protein n=1 Tax=Synechococcus sp. RC10B2 TaxID=2964530 RepID=UPI0039C61CAA
MRIAHLSDVHLGYRAYSRTNEHGMNQREYDVLQAFRRALRAVRDAEPDLVLITGDLFHAVRPPNSSLLAAYSYLSDFQKSRRNAPLVIIAGNHETPRVAGSGCILALLKHLDGVQVVYDQIDGLEIPALNATLLCIPARGVPDIERRILQPNPNTRYNLLLLHGLLEGVTQLTLERPIDRQKIVRDEWDYIALGDWHIYQQVAPNAIYAGATEFTSTNIWEEAGEPKGWVLYDADTRTHEFHKIRTRQVYDLLPIDAADMTAVELNQAIESRADALGDALNGAIVRQRVWNLHPDLRRQIDGELLRELKARALHYLLDPRPPRPSTGGRAYGQTSETDGESRLTLADEWRLFAAAYDLPADIDRAAFIELGARYLQEADATERG